MKKCTFLVVTVLLFFTLAGCSGSFVSESGHDVTELERCIDDMVDADSITACEATDRDILLEDYIRSFESNFTISEHYTINSLEYSISKTGDIERIEFWFQYALLPEADGQANYEIYKEIFETMSTELEQMNDVPEYIFSGEFMFEGHLIYKYHHDKDNNISGEVLYLHHTETFPTVLAAIEAFNVSVADDDDLFLQTFTMTSSEHSVKVYVHPSDNTYSYDIYQSSPEAVTTVSEAEALIEAAFAPTGLTLITE